MQNEHVISYILKLSILILFFSSCQGSDHSATESESPETAQKNSEPVNSVKAPGQTDNVVAEKQLLSLSAENLLFISSDSVQAWSDRQKTDLLCQLPFGSQFLITDKKEEWLKIRLDRIAEKSPIHCPEDAYEAWVLKEETGQTAAQESPDKSVISSDGPLNNESGEDILCQLNEGDQIEIVERISPTERKIKTVSGSCYDQGFKEGWIRQASMLTSTEKNSKVVRFIPHRLTFDLKVYGNEKKDGPSVCLIAKGNSILVSQTSSQKIQMPKSKQCDPVHDFVWFTYVPGLWWEDQPK